MTEVNSGPGALFLDAEQRIIAVWALEIADGQIRSVSGIVNPDKLAHFGPVGCAQQASLDDALNSVDAVIDATRPASVE